MSVESVLTINAGSSSIKFALFGIAGKIDRIGLPGTKLTFRDTKQDKQGSCAMEGMDEAAATEFLIHWLEKNAPFFSVTAIGHRIVHGMRHSRPMLFTPDLLAELHRISSYDPDHLPREIHLVEAFGMRHPALPQVACFDTAFHTDMPQVAKLLPIPRRFHAKGIQRYGFHGLSYTFLMEELARIGGAEASLGRVILAHLGNGASLAAVHKGRSVDTSMGFTPTSGLPMGTRPGDLDPGVAWYLMRDGNLTPEQFNHLINHDCGLLGVSETSSDLRDLLESQTTDVRAAEAVELFCYQTRKWIGAFAAVLGGLDTLVFSGGIGENSVEIRRRICEGLKFLGIELEGTRNAAANPLISSDVSRVAVRVLRTNEEQMIAREVCRFLEESANQ